MALRSKDGHADKGVSLARFPALVLGSILLAFGLLALLQNGDTPTGGFPDGTAVGENLLGFEVNGWTAFFTAVAGGLLLFGAAQHLLAKTMSLLVGLALGACSVIALVDGDDVLGLAAANGWTKLGWGVASAFLLINTLLPRKGGKTKHRDTDRDRDRDLDYDRDRRPAVAPTRATTPAPRETDVTRRESVASAPRDTEVTHREVVAPASDTDHVHRETERTTRVDEAPAERTGRFDRDTERRVETDDTYGGTSRDAGSRDIGSRDAGSRDGSISEDRLPDDRTRR